MHIPTNPSISILKLIVGIRSPLYMNEHSQFVQLTFSKSLSRLGGTLELTFHMSICGFSAYMRFLCICECRHIRIHYADFFYAVSCGYVHINPHEPQLHMRQWKTTAWPTLIWIAASLNEDRNWGLSASDETSIQSKGSWGQYYTKPSNLKMIFYCNIKCKIP